MPPELLPNHVEDPVARAALALATRTLTEEFSAALAAGAGPGYATQVLPAAAAPKVDAALAVRLFAALAATVARLVAEQPPACVAEELMAIALVAEATSALEDDRQLGRLTEEQVEIAGAALAGVFDLLGGDDVLLLFEQGAEAQQLEVWFRPFAGVAALGHLSDDRGAHARS